MSQKPRVVRAPPEITLLRGRTVPLEAGRAEADEALLAEEVRALTEEGLLPEAGFEPEEGLPAADGVVARGAAVFSTAGGTFACATGSPPPPPERL